MSRKGHSRAAGAFAAALEWEEGAHGHNTLEVQDADIDPVMGALRFGMDTISKIVNETLPYCPAEDEQLKRNIANRMEGALMQLVESELSYCQTSGIVNQVVEELALQDNPEMDAKEFSESVESIQSLSHQRIGEYKATLTEDILKSHPTFLRINAELNSLLNRMNIDDPDNADAETEAEEVDADDSVLFDEEVIPSLDPLTKQPLKDPVRNKICRHIYGKNSMLQFIKTNPKTRCPAMGCVNPQLVKASHLIEDPKLTAKVNGQPLPPKLSRALPAPEAGSSRSPKAKRGRRRR